MASISRKRTSPRRSEVQFDDVSWKDVFEKTDGIPESIKTKAFSFDNPPSILHLFINGSHEEIIRLLVTEEHFPKVEAAVEEIMANLETKRIDIESKFPSASDYGKSIKRMEGICDHRFFSDLHVGLQVQAFGNFIVSMKSVEAVDSRYNKVASTLMLRMSGKFLSEVYRVQEFKCIVEELGEMFQFQISDGPGHRTDSIVLVNRVTLANWEFKNEFLGNSTCPVTQNIGYFVHLGKKKVGRSPMLLVSVIGCHYLQVFGAVWNGNKCVCVDPLCSPISMLFVPRDPNKGVSKLARVFSVMDKTMGELLKYYEKNDTDIRAPYWTDNGRLKYKSNLVKEVKWLIEATLDGDSEVLVKFTHTHYGEAVHRLLADASLAPKLIKLHPLPGGWYAVVMEKLGGRSITTTENSAVKQSLETAVTLMHQSNYVHGDLRPQNIIVDEDDTVRILDFDWADTENFANYPPELSMDTGCKWHPDVSPGGKIHKEHDLFQIKSICG